MNAGNKAVESFKDSDDMIEKCLKKLRQKGYAPVTEYRFELEDLRAPPWCGETYVRADYFIRGIPGFVEGLIISSKHQNSAGTVDKKIYYHARHIIKKCYPYPTILMLTGVAWNDIIKRNVLYECDGAWLVKVFYDWNALLMWTNGVPKISQARAITMLKQQPLFEGLD